jgi:hypothetical protein
MPTRMIFSLIAIVLVAAAMLYTGRQQLDATQAAAAARKGSAPVAAPPAPATAIEPNGSDPTYPVQPTADVTAPAPADAAAPAVAPASKPEATTPRASAATP